MRKAKIGDRVTLKHNDGRKETGTVFEVMDSGSIEVHIGTKAVTLDPLAPVSHKKPLDAPEAPTIEKVDKC